MNNKKTLANYQPKKPTFRRLSEYYHLTINK